MDQAIWVIKAGTIQCDQEYLGFLLLIVIQYKVHPFPNKGTRKLTTDQRKTYMTVQRYPPIKGILTHKFEKSISEECTILIWVTSYKIIIEWITGSDISSGCFYYKY